MPRKPRIPSSTGIYHITLRSVNQHIIFEETSDYQKFLFLLNDCKKKHDIDIYAYCIMDNHIHLLLRSDLNTLSQFFQSLGSTFVRWYNNKYGRSGHLFQERYHSIAIEDRSAYLAVLAYIHNNPVCANVCRFPSEYQWSSYRAFYGEKNTLLNLAFSYAMAGTKDILLQYFASHNEESEEEFFVSDHRESAHFLTDEQALATFRSVTGLSTAAEASRLPKPKRNEYIRELRKKHLTVKQIARIMDVSVSTVKRI